MDSAALSATTLPCVRTGDIAVSERQDLAEARLETCSRRGTLARPGHYWRRATCFQRPRMNDEPLIILQDDRSSDIATDEDLTGQDKSLSSYSEGDAIAGGLMADSVTVLRRPSGPLRGVKIIEFAGIGPIPFAGMLLSDLGAEIVRIERIGTRNDPREAVNRGRSFVQVDLKNSDCIEEILQLAESADAIMEGFRPGVMERLGLGPEIILKRNPRLVYGRMTGWGQDGPLARSAGHDINYIAISGALAAIGPREAPVPPLIWWATMAAGRSI
jgi:hypothetical protein